VAVGGAGGGSWVGCGDKTEHAETKITTNTRRNNLRSIAYLPETNTVSGEFPDLDNSTSGKF
jgi:hypothetical protein